MAERMIPFNQLSKGKYQTSLNRGIINRIKRDYHEDMVQPAIVSFRDGKYWIVDGQHRSQAKYELNNNDPNTPILCDVRMGLTYEQEADLFHRLNTGSRILKIADDIKALIEAQDDVAVEFRDVVESCGYTMFIHTSNSIDAISTIWRIFKMKNGKDTLAKILTITNACWPLNRKGVHSNILRGLVLFLKNHGDEYQQDQFIKALCNVDPGVLIKDAETLYRGMNSKSFSMPYCVYAMIVKRYNYKLRSNKLTAVLPED